MAWASEDVTKLIAHIKQHPILYNRDLPNDAAAYAEAVEDVQMAVNKPWAMIKKKWSELRHYHKSIYFGYTKNKKQEQPKWKYYDMMAFAFDSLYQIQDDEVLVSNEEYPSKFESLMVKMSTFYFHSLMRKTRVKSSPMRHLLSMDLMTKTFNLGRMEVNALGPKSVNVRQHQRQLHW